MKEEYQDLNVVVIYEKVESHWSEFRCYEVIYTSEGKNGYEKLGANSSDDTTENIEEAQTLIKGVVKWDGCCHYTFGDEEGYIHLCGGHNVKRLSEIIKKVYNRCGELMNEKRDTPLEDFPIK